jgi:hypothetical protein
MTSLRGALTFFITQEQADPAAHPCYGRGRRGNPAARWI